MNTSGNMMFFSRPSAPPTPQLPYDYAVEYIETDGVASYIDTGIPVDGSDVRLAFNFAFVGSQASITSFSNVLYHLQTSWTAFTCQAGGTINPGTLSGGFDTTGDVFYDCEVQFFSGDRYAKVNGTVVGTSTSTAIVKPPCNFPIGAGYSTSGELRRVGHVKCSKFQIFDHDGNCKFNGIPVVDRNGVACMYDYVSNTMKYNAASSGTITAGPILEI